MAAVEGKRAIGSSDRRRITANYDGGWACRRSEMDAGTFTGSGDGNGER